ncbi:unnamed protein product [Caretta caretta]
MDHSVLSISWQSQLELDGLKCHEQGCRTVLLIQSCFPASCQMIAPRVPIPASCTLIGPNVSLVWDHAMGSQTDPIFDFYCKISFQQMKIFNHGIEKIFD